MILQNTSIGSLTSAATHVGAEASSSESSIMTYVLPTIGIFSSVMISWRIKKYTSSQDFGPGDISPVTTIEKNGEKDKGQYLKISCALLLYFVSDLFLSVCPSMTFVI